jgi:hypothetical protein
MRLQRRVARLAVVLATPPRVSREQMNEAAHRLRAAVGTRVLAVIDGADPTEPSDADQRDGETIRRWCKQQGLPTDRAQMMVHMPVLEALSDEQLDRYSERLHEIERAAGREA